MADTTQGDTDGQYLTLLGPALIALIAGLLIHSFIIGVNVTDWWKGRSVTPVDLIVTSLGISRICAQSVSTLYLFVVRLLLSSLDSLLTLVIISAVYSLFNYTNIWLISLLSIVFYLKISNLHTRLFLYLRRMMVYKTGYHIGASVLLSAFNSFSSLSITVSEVSNGETRNMTGNNLFRDCIFIKSIYHTTIGPFIPLLFSFISSVLLFTSLYHHTTKMKMSSNLSISLETYYSAMKLVSFTFTYNTIYLIFLFIGVFYYYSYCEDLVWFFIVLDFLPVLHSSYLIYRTAKLRSQMSKVLQNVIYFFFQRKDTETRENKEVIAP